MLTKLIATAATAALFALPTAQVSLNTTSPEETEPILTVVNTDGTTDFSTGSLGVKVLPATAPTVNDPISPKSAAAVITCTLTVDNAHGSTHVAGTINVVAKVNCTGGVAGSIQLATQLIRMTPSHAEWGATTKTVLGKSFASNNAATSCSAGPGDFRGWAMMTVAPPPGYHLTTSPVAKKYGNTTPVSCGVSSRASTSADDPAESLTITFTPVNEHSPMILNQ